MVATSVAIIHEQNFKATEQVEIIGGSDGVVRINIDGVCALRIRVMSGCKLDLDVEGIYRLVGRRK